MELHRTTAAIHTIANARAKPEDSAAFTYFEVQAQVIHSILQFGRVSPLAASLFFNGRMGALRML